jgi:C-terminal processing protease CtpA/Prc
MKMTMTVALLALLPLGLQAAGGESDTAQLRRELANLRAFAKLYGYIRYFHPSDEASRIDQTKLAIYGVDRVLKAKSTAGLESTLKEIFLPIAPTIDIYPTGKQLEPIVPPVDTAGLEAVAWEHHGVYVAGDSMGGSPYVSLRSHRPNALWSGVAFQSLPARPLLNRTIRLSARMKTRFTSSRSKAFLGLAMDTTSGYGGQQPVLCRTEVRSPDWQRYEVLARVDPKAGNIGFAGQLCGSGKLWLDEFRLEVQDARGRWRDVKIASPGFEGPRASDDWNTGGAGFTGDTTSLERFAGRRSFLIENDTASPFGKWFPRPGEFRVKELGAGLACRFLLSLYSDSAGTLGRNEQYPYARLDSALVRSNLDSLTWENPALRLGDAIVAWNVFQHFYPYFDVVKTDWDSALTGALQEARADTSQEDFLFTLRHLVAQLRDGHGNVSHVLRLRKQFPPFRVEWIEDRVVVTSADDPAQLKPGDIVLSVDSAPAESAVRRSEDYISGSPQWRRWRALLAFGVGEPGTSIQLEVMRGDSIFHLALPRRPQVFPPAPSGAPRQLRKGIWYVDLSNVAMPEIEKKMSVLARARGVVFDLRGYPNSNHAVIQHLLTRPDTARGWMSIAIRTTPDRESVASWDTFGWNLSPRKPHIGGKVVFLTDSRAISYAESFMGFIEGNRLGEIVGEPTAGTNGNVNPFVLPGGFNVSWTGMRVRKHDGSQQHLIGILPTAPVRKTIKAIREGRDEYLERALEIIETAGK